MQLSYRGTSYPFTSIDAKRWQSISKNSPTIFQTGLDASFALVSRLTFKSTPLA
jgi:hypothetical protein